jgi:hypothetical protein
VTLEQLIIELQKFMPEHAQTEVSLFVRGWSERLCKVQLESNRGLLIELMDEE